MFLFPRNNTTILNKKNKTIDKVSTGIERSIKINFLLISNKVRMKNKGQIHSHILTLLLTNKTNLA